MALTGKQANLTPITYCSSTTANVAPAIPTKLDPIFVDVVSWMLTATMMACWIVKMAVLCDAAKMAVGLCGCGMADMDTNNIDTPDCQDGCSQDASKIAPGVCRCGKTNLHGCQGHQAPPLLYLIVQDLAMLELLYYSYGAHEDPYNILFVRGCHLLGGTLSQISIG